MEYDARHPFHGLATTTDRILKWDEARKAAAWWTAREATMRTALFTEIFPDPKEGVNVFVLGAGYELKATHKMNFLLPSKDSSKDVRSVATTIANMTAQTDPTLADRLFKWKADLAVGEYRKIDVKSPIMTALSTVLTIKPAMPSIEIVPPKEGA